MDMVFFWVLRSPSRALTSHSVAMEKMDLYRASGIYPGKNLIFTYETDDHPLDIKGMRKMLEELFC